MAGPKPAKDSSFRNVKELIRDFPEINTPGLVFGGARSGSEQGFGDRVEVKPFLM